MEQVVLNVSQLPPPDVVIEDDRSAPHARIVISLELELVGSFSAWHEWLGAIGLDLAQAERNYRDGFEREPNEEHAS